MRLDRRLARLEQQLPAPSPGHLLWERINASFFAKVDKALKLMTEEELDHAHQGVVLTSEDGQVRTFFDRWLDDLSAGHSRLPKLTAAVLKDLLVAWLSPDVTPVTCQRCGLEYPPCKGDVGFESCPACKSPDWDWTHQAADCERPWQKLEGCVHAGKSCGR
jgi:hypothetical protein